MCQARLRMHLHVVDFPGFHSKLKSGCIRIGSSFYGRCRYGIIILIDLLTSDSKTSFPGLVSYGK